MSDYQVLCDTGKHKLAVSPAAGKAMAAQQMLEVPSEQCPGCINESLERLNRIADNCCNEHANGAGICDVADHGAENCRFVDAAVEVVDGPRPWSSVRLVK